VNLQQDAHPVGRNLLLENSNGFHGLCGWL